jgi:hypothetical protein
VLAGPGACDGHGAGVAKTGQGGRQPRSPRPSARSCTRRRPSSSNRRKRRSCTCPTTTRASSTARYAAAYSYYYEHYYGLAIGQRFVQQVVLRSPPTIGAGRAPTGAIGASRCPPAVIGSGVARAVHKPRRGARGNTTPCVGAAWILPAARCSNASAAQRAPVPMCRAQCRRMPTRRAQRRPSTVLRRAACPWQAEHLRPWAPSAADRRAWGRLAAFREVAGHRRCPGRHPGRRGRIEKDIDHGSDSSASRGCSCCCRPAR